MSCVYCIFFCSKRPIIDRDIYYTPNYRQQLQIMYFSYSSILYCYEPVDYLYYLYDEIKIIQTMYLYNIYCTMYRVVKLWILQWNFLYVPVQYLLYSTIVDLRYLLKYSLASTVKTDGTTLFIPQFFSYRRGTYTILWNSEWNNPHCLFQIIPLPGYHHRGTVDFLCATQPRILREV